MIYVGKQDERKKWIWVTTGILVASLVIAMIFGFGMFVDPIVNLLTR